MKKIAIVTDSNSGITQSLATQMNINVIPMPFTIQNVDYFEDINLTQDEFYQKLSDNADIKTSQPSPDTLLSTWEMLLKKYDEIVHIPMSSGLSSSCQTAIMLANDFDGRVQVVNNQRISVTLRQSVLDAMNLIESGNTAKEIKEILENDKFNSSIYILLDTLYYLKKGGRITPAAAALGALLKIKPVLQIQGEKLDAFAKARTLNQGKTIMINAIKNDIINRFGGIDSIHVDLHIAHSNNLPAALELKKELESIFPGYAIHVDPLSLSIACHIGPGSLAIACTQKLDV